MIASKTTGRWSIKGFKRLIQQSDIFFQHSWPVVAMEDSAVIVVFTKKNKTKQKKKTYSINTFFKKSARDYI